MQKELKKAHLTTLRYIQELSILVVALLKRMHPILNKFCQHWLSKSPWLAQSQDALSPNISHVATYILKGIPNCAKCLFFLN